MWSILNKNNCLEAIKERPTRITNDKWDKMDDNIIVDQYLTLADGVLSSVAEEKIAMGILDTLTK